MVFNTATVGSAVTPAVVQTFMSHYLNRKPLAQKPTAHISYDEGLSLIRKFLIHASHHTVEDVQRFTAQWVPHPRWVKVDEVKVDQEYITKAAEAIQEQLGHHGIEKVGGKTWWQWRRPGSELKAEWIEMRSDYVERKKSGMSKGGKRVMFYVHGGAYFFGSVDEHRYQLQRHARKLKARVFARPYLPFIARYRLAPQFPFPCGLHDCLSAYLHLLTMQDPSTIILAGDSAGGGMVLSMLVTLRDQGIPLPAGAVLISPWVDLTHSFPSVGDDNPLDYIPPYGFHQRPSPSWPPPNSDDMMAIQEGIVKKMAHKEHLPQSSEADAVQGFHVNENPAPGTTNENAATGTVAGEGDYHTANTLPGPNHNLSIMIDGNLVEIKDQIQMYASNQLISHPLVSPILQPSLGGLPPLLILTGGGEALRDEQIYLAHKASNPSKYPPGDAYLDENPHDRRRDEINKWKPTDVQLQVWDDLCHVAPTLSFTRPAKYMYRSVAQFGAWALARAQKTEIEILDDDDVSVISASDSDAEGPKEVEKDQAIPGSVPTKISTVGKAGDPLPAFKNHMIRQRVDRHGDIYPLEPPSQLAACTMKSEEIGVIKQAPVKKWMTAKKQWDTKYSSSKRSVQKRRAKEIAEGYQTFGNGEVPPPSALAGRRRKGDADREQKKTKSMGMSLWALWGSKHDEKTMVREAEADKAPETTTASAEQGANARPLHDTVTKEGKRLGADNPPYSRSRSRRRTVTDQNQTGEKIDENTSAAELLALKKSYGEKVPASDMTPEFVTEESNETLIATASPISGSGIPAIITPAQGDTKEAEMDPTIDLSKHRPKANGIAFPFSLKRSGENGTAPSSSASLATLTSAVGFAPAEDTRTVDALRSGVPGSSHGSETNSVSALMMKSEKGKGKVVENGEIVNASRPELDSFVTASEDLPKVKGV